MRGGSTMRSLLVLAVVAAALSNAGSAQAQGKYWPWCVYYDAWSYNCGFASFEQCLATARPEGGFCKQNPYGPPVSEPRGRRAVQRGY